MYLYSLTFSLCLRASAAGVGLRRSTARTCKKDHLLALHHLKSNIHPAKIIFHLVLAHPSRISTCSVPFADPSRSCASVHNFATVFSLCHRQGSCQLTILTVFYLNPRKLSMSGPGRERIKGAGEAEGDGSKWVSNSRPMVLEILQSVCR